MGCDHKDKLKHFPEDDAIMDHNESSSNKSPHRSEVLHLPCPVQNRGFKTIYCLFFWTRNKRLLNKCCCGFKVPGVSSSSVPIYLIAGRKIDSEEWHSEMGISLHAIQVKIWIPEKLEQENFSVCFLEIGAARTKHREGQDFGTDEQLYAA